MNKEKEKIILFANEKFFKDGFHKTSMNEIASELKISKKTIYKHFSSKEELIDEVLRYFTLNVKSKVLPAINTNKNAIEKLFDVLFELAKISEKITSKILTEFKLHMPKQWQEIDSFRTKMMYGNLSKIIEQGKKEKLFVDYPTAIIMNVLVSSLRSIVNPEFILQNNFSVYEAAKNGFKIIISGILTEKGRKIFNKVIKEKKL